MLLTNEAFQIAAQQVAQQGSDKWYLIIVSTALSGALIYMFKRYEAINSKFNEEREKTFKDMKGLLEESAEAKRELSESIKSLNRDSEQRHRSTMDMLDRIHAKP